MHGFYVDEENQLVSFDLIFNFDEEDHCGCVNEICSILKEKYPRYQFSVILDTDFSD